MQDKPKLSMKKKLLVILAVVITLIIVIIGAFAVTNFVTANNAKKQSATELKAEADTLKARAIKAQAEKNNTAAIELLEEAKEKYEQAGDTNNAIDAESLLFISKQAK